MSAPCRPLHAPIPAPGQLVTVRQRRCVVFGPPEAWSPDARRDLAGESRRRLVTAQALDEDGGEADELTVVPGS